MNIMRRHSLEPENLRQQIKSVFISPTRKFFNFKTNTKNSNSIFNWTRRPRRFSVPEKQTPNRLDSNSELETIHEVSQTNSLRVICLFMSALLLYLFVVNSMHVINPSKRSCLLFSS